MSLGLDLKSAQNRRCRMINLHNIQDSIDNYSERFLAAKEWLNHGYTITRVDGDNVYGYIHNLESQERIVATWAKSSWHVILSEYRYSHQNDQST